MLRAVIPLVCRQRRRGRVVDELVAHAGWKLARLGHLLATGRFPSFPAIARALDDLTKPAAGLGSVYPIRIRRRSLEVVHLPTGEMRPANVPFFSFPVRCENERSFARANQHSYLAHSIAPFCNLMRLCRSS